MLRERDLSLPDGRTLHVYDSGAGTGPELATVFWHHGTPQSGLPPEPLVAVAAEHGVRWLSFDRPGYGTSTPVPGRDVAAVAADTATVADALGVRRFAALGASGGGPHALACAALLPDRAPAAACIATVAPFEAAGLDWFAGMADSGADEFRAAAAGRAALERYIEQHTFSDPDPDLFAPADSDALSGPYAPWLAVSTLTALDSGRGGWLDDDLAYVRPWGVDVADIRGPALLMHGEQDHVVPVSHAAWLADRCPHVELRLLPTDGHVSVFEHSEIAVEWLVRHARTHG